MEVFGRDPGYDTTFDPIVRVTAAEIRKRIAQYYQDAGKPDELRISLPPGSYIPHFEWPKSPVVMEATPAIAMPIAIELGSSTLAPGRSAQTTEQKNKVSRGFHTSRLLACGLLLAIVFVGGWTWVRSRPTTLDRFWSPVLSAADTVVVCFPQSDINGIILRDAANPLQQRRLEEKMNGVVVVVDDLQPLVSLSGLLEMRHQRYNLMGEEAATLTTLRQGPAIFIGAFDNPWTLRLTRDLRFRFGNNSEMTQFWIEVRSPRQRRVGVSIGTCSKLQTTIATTPSSPASQMRIQVSWRWSQPASRAVAPWPLASFSPGRGTWIQSAVRHRKTGPARIWNLY